MNRKGLFCIGLFLVAVPAIAGINVQLNTAKDWPSVAGKIAIVPANCPVEFDCATINKVITKRFAKRSDIDSVDLAAVQQALFDISAEELTEQNADQLSKTLGVQSFFLVTVDYSGRNIGLSSGNSPVAASFEIAQGNISVRVVSPDGKLLARATGFGQSSWVNESQVMANTFEEVFDRLFPRTTKSR